MISVSTPGKMEGCTKASTLTTKNMAMASILGAMERSTLVGGIRESSMV